MNWIFDAVSHSFTRVIDPKIIKTTSSHCYINIKMSDLISPLAVKSLTGITNIHIYRIYHFFFFFFANKKQKNFLKYCTTSDDSFVKTKRIIWTVDEWIFGRAKSWMNIHWWMLKYPLTIRYSLLTFSWVNCCWTMMSCL